MQISKLGIISTLLTLVSAVVITSCFQPLPLMSDLWSYFYIFVTVLIINCILFSVVLDIENDFIFIGKITLHSLFFVGGVIIFFAMYFTIFYSLQSMTFESINDCQVSGKLTKNLQGSESYSILYVNFKYRGQNMLGYACQSNQVSASLGDEPFPYQFITNGTYYNCENPEKYQSSYDVAPRSLAISKRQREIINLQNTYVHSSRSNPGRAKGCQPYNFSQVKVPSWLCVDFNLSHEQLTKPQTCYINFYENEDKAFENAQERMDLRKIKNFAFVSFSENIHYDKEGLSYIIIFAYYPFLLSFDIIFYLILLAFK